MTFSPIAVLWKRLQLDSKTDLTRNGLILEFFVSLGLASLSLYLHGLKYAKFAEMFFSFDDINSFRYLV